MILIKYSVHSDLYADASCEELSIGVDIVMLT